MIQRITPLRRMSKKRAKQTRSYMQIRREYLAKHPLCQMSIHDCDLSEEIILQVWRKRTEQNPGEVQDGIRIFKDGKIINIPLASEIHHRNRRHGARLTDARWFMAVCPTAHRKIEATMNWARARGYLLEVSANPDGMTPGGMQGLTTDELMGRLK